MGIGRLLTLHETLADLHRRGRQPGELRIAKGVGHVGGRRRGAVVRADIRRRQEGETCRLRRQAGTALLRSQGEHPGCTTQACSLRDFHPDIEEKDIVIIGVGPDTPERLAKFRAKCNLPFVLLSDPDHAVAEAYGAWGEWRLYGRRLKGSFGPTSRSAGTTQSTITG